MASAAVSMSLEFSWLIKTGVMFELREVMLRNKSQQLLPISTKATVPILQLPDSTVIDESLDIMNWALSYNDTEK